MAIEKLNVPNSSKNFEGEIANFMRALDDPRALGRYVLDKASRQSFFKGFPGLVMTKVQENGRVGDEFLIDEKWNMAIGGPGLPGPYRPDRQLSGNEDIIDAAFRRDKMTVGVRRYSVAVENFVQSNLLPNPLLAALKNNITTWATYMEDMEVASTLFRDFTYYFAESNNLSAGEIDRRVLPLFGRGTLNDIEAAPLTLYPNGKTDIEDLDETDTLSDTFLRYSQMLSDQELGMNPLTMQDGRPFFGLVVGDPDVQNFYLNSSTQLQDALKYSFAGKEWNNPLFKLTLGEFAGIRLFKYGWLGSNAQQISTDSVYNWLMGSPFVPLARVLGAVKGDESVPSLRVWDRGDLAPEVRSGLDGNADNYSIYVSMGAVDFPFFSGTRFEFDTYGVEIGEQSYNKAVVGQYDGDKDGNADDIAGLSYSDVSNDRVVGRLQIGESNEAGGKYKILYTGPYFTGLLQIGSNKTPFAQMHTVYRLKVQALYKWDGSKWILVGNDDMANEFEKLREFLGIDPTSHIINISWTYGGLKYIKRRKAHIFNTVRTILFGKELMYEAEIGPSAKVEYRKGIDYGAADGIGITVVNGKKLKRSADGSIRSYAVVVFKRPPVLS